MPTLLAATHLTKRYGGVVALADGSLTVDSGEVVALVGANGSGKSTLSKILTGVVAPDGGELALDGAPVRFSSPHAARERGITAVYQELSLIPDMTVAENIWLAHEPRRGRIAVHHSEVTARTRALLALFAGAVPAGLGPDVPVAQLPPDEKQIVEILKGLSLAPRLLILDEATASLDSRQVNRLFELVQGWQKTGRATVIVTHRMEEIFRIAGRAVVLRNGHTVGALSLTGATERDLVQLMTGDALPVSKIVSASPAAGASGALRLQVNSLHSRVLQGVSLALRDGELLGLGGLRGQGQEDLLLALFGAQSFTGDVNLAGQPVHFSHPQQAMQQGVAYVPGERNAQGLLAIRSILENLQLPSWIRYGPLLNMKAVRADAAAVTTDLRVVMAGLDAPVNSLSGGNAQKIVLGKWLLRRPALLLLNDPTKGVDVGAKAEIYALLDRLRREGAAILFYSSDDEELLHLCDRVLVLHDGAVHAELAGPTLNRAELIAASVGASHASARQPAV